MKYTPILLIICYCCAPSFTALTFDLRDKPNFKTDYRPSQNLSDETGSIWPEKNEHGFIPVGNDGSDLFYWFFPARENPDKAP